MTKLLPLALLAASAVPASAQTYAAPVPSGQAYVASDTEYAREPIFKQVDARIGVMLGGSDVGDADGFSAGGSAAIGYRMGDLTLRGLFDYYRVGDGVDEGMERKGRATRLGGAIRYSLAHNDFDKGGIVDFWGELGAGYEHVAWRRGGVLDRPSGEVAFGLDLGGLGEPRRDRRRRKVGAFVAFRSLIAQGPELDGVMATCAGPCTQATKPSRTDVSMFFELGVHWGR